MEIFVLKALVVGQLGLLSGMGNDALMHREDSKGFKELTYCCINYGDQSLSFNMKSS